MLHATPATYGAPRGGDETDGFVPFGDTNSKLYEWLTMTHSDIFAAPAQDIVFVAPAPVVEHRTRRTSTCGRVHEQLSVLMALASATHHSHMRVASVATQTDDAAAACAATASAFVVLYVVPASDADAAPALAVECVAPAPVITNIEQLITEF